MIDFTNITQKQLCNIITLKSLHCNSGNKKKKTNFGSLLKKLYFCAKINFNTIVMKNLVFLFVASLLATCCTELPEFESLHEEPNFSRAYSPDRRSLSEVIDIAQKAISLVENGDMGHTRSAVPYRSINLTNGIKYITSSSQTRSGISIVDTSLYVLNFDEDMGFAIIATNRNLSPIIAVAEQGNYDPNTKTENVGFEDYMSNVKKIVAMEDSKLHENSYQSYSNGSYRPTYAMYKPFYDTIINIKVSPKIKVRWGQTKMMVKNTDHPYSGCGPTAILQIMSAFHFPDVYNEYQFSSKRVLRVNKTPWDMMTNEDHKYTFYNNYDTEAYKAIANLAFELGMLSHSEYRAKETITTFDNLRSATMSYGFKCDPIVAYDKNCLRDFLSLSNQLESGKLICMYGNSIPKNSIGHFYAIDGCEYNTCNYSIKGSNDGVHWYRDPDFDIYNVSYGHYFVHINWGWDGYGNGYFDYNILDANRARRYDESDDYINTANLQDINYDCTKNQKYFTIYR